MKAKKYIQMPDDAFLKILDGKCFKTECCDCGLVHFWTLESRKEGRKNVFGYRIQRDNRATAQRRRHR